MKWKVQLDETWGLSQFLNGDIWRRSTKTCGSSVIPYHSTPSQAMWAIPNWISISSGDQVWNRRETRQEIGAGILLGRLFSIKLALHLRVGIERLWRSRDDGLCIHWQSDWASNYKAASKKSFERKYNYKKHVSRGGRRLSKFKWEDEATHSKFPIRNVWKSYWESSSCCCCCLMMASCCACIVSRMEVWMLFW